MKRNLLIFAVLCAVLLSGCSQDKVSQTPPKCDDERVLKILKDFTQKYSSFCDPNEPQSKWCMAKQGEFSDIVPVLASATKTKCEAWYSFGEYSYFFEYSAKFEKGNLVVERL